MKRNSVVMWVGFIVLLSGFVYDITFAGIPYPDPTPQMQQQWEFHRSIANGMYTVGAITIFVCLTIALVSHIRHRKKAKKAS
ncbi:MAG: hypothetical protein MK137_05860 [Rickettsiales bacterium]|nr:hypothetical protein [Rickettsiales bacterium]